MRKFYLQAMFGAFCCLSSLVQAADFQDPAHIAGAHQAAVAPAPLPTAAEAVNLPADRITNEHVFIGVIPVREGLQNSLAMQRIYSAADFFYHVASDGEQPAEHLQVILDHTNAYLAAHPEIEALAHQIIDANRFSHFALLDRLSTMNQDMQNGILTAIVLSNADRSFGATLHEHMIRDITRALRRLGHNEEQIAAELPGLLFYTLRGFAQGLLAFPRDPEMNLAAYHFCQYCAIRVIVGE